jgi:hypothetical protein
MLVILLFGLQAGPLSAAEPPKVRTLRTQQVGDTVYFQVRFEPPASLEDVNLRADFPGQQLFHQGSNYSRLPRLVPQDDKTQAVYYRFEIPEGPGGPVAAQPPPQAAPTAKPGSEPVAKDPNLPPQGLPVPQGGPVQTNAPPVEGLEFIGKAVRGEQVTFLLLYATRESAPAPNAAPGKRGPHRAGKRPPVEVPVTLDLAAAPKVALPASAKKRKQGQPVAADDLEGLWAIAQAEQFAVLEAQSTDFSFYGFAREATGRKYGVTVPMLPGENRGRATPDAVDRQLYETTTGAAAITESLQQHRMLNPGVRDAGERKIEVAKVAGIDIAEHPWKEMIGNKQPAIEPIARLVPNDNYYLHFKNFSKLVELGDLIDQWGADIIRAYEMHSRDLRLRKRYEQQLCIHSTKLGRLLGPAVIQSLAVTGSDVYFREGTDVTLLFQVRNKELFLTALAPFLQEARQQFGAQLQEDKTDYQGVRIESFVTPLREVSLHRAVLGDVVLYSNSSVALRRIIDTAQGRHKALADSLDFQYMRSVYPLKDPLEDGFLFLSDPFIRQLVGPASKIKEKRRLEALTSLVMVTNAVLFTAWENAKLQVDQKTLLTASGLKADELYAPGARDVAWDAGRGVALSDMYNTLAFATPLIELPIDRVTPLEEQSYQRFRGEYLGLWRQYFDPVGMRVALKDQQVRVETYILPLIQSTAYNQLKDVVGGGTTRLDPAALSPRTLIQLTSHLNPKGEMRSMLTSELSILDGRISFDFLGDWFVLRLDDSPVYAKLAALLGEELIDNEVDPRDNFDLLFEIPLTIGVEIRNPGMLAGLLGAIRVAVMGALPGTVTWGAMEPAHKGISIVRIQADAEKVAEHALGKGNAPPLKPNFHPALYYALIGNGFFLSLREEPLKELIDGYTARRDGKVPANKGEPLAINSSLYVAPGAATQAGEAIRQFLGQEVQKHALASTSPFYLLYRTGLVNAATPPGKIEATALRYLGFIPVSPDGTPFLYESKTDEVRNIRYGSPRRPEPPAALDKDSPVARLLDQLQSLRADLQFREDGIQTVLTLDRKGTAKQKNQGVAAKP